MEKNSDTTETDLGMKAEWVNFNFSKGENCDLFASLDQETFLNPTALRKAKNLWSFGSSECNRVNGIQLLKGRIRFYR